MPACNLIIDSCCDLPFDVVDREGIELIEFPYIAGDGEHSDDMYRSRSAHDFFDSMRNGDEPSTAQVPLTVYQDVFTRAIESGVPTVCLSFSSGLSGSYNTAMIIRDQLVAEHPEAELYVVDTLLASIAEGFLVYEAEALRRGGRIPASVALAGSKLDVKPLLNITLDGKLSLTGVARGRKKGIKQLAEYYAKHVSDEGAARFAVIGNADCPKDADRLKETLSKIDENILFLESSIGPVIGSHVGPGMLAVVFWGKDRREELSVADRIARKVKGN